MTHRAMRTLLATTLVVLNIVSTNAKARELLFGSVAMDIPAVMHKRLTPLTNYLSEQLNQPVVLRLSPNMGSAIEQIAKNNVDLAYLTPVAYLKAREQGGAKLVVKTITNGKGSFQLVIVVKQESSALKPEDLKGKSFAFGDKRALLQRAAVLGAGLKLSDFSEYKFIGHYDNIARAVKNGDFEAGILKDTMAYKWQSKGLRIIFSSPNLPPYNIAASGTTSDATVEKLRAAFLALDKSNPEHLKIINALDKKYNGFAQTSDQEYDIVRELIRPFSK